MIQTKSILQNEIKISVFITLLFDFLTLLSMFVFNFLKYILKLTLRTKLSEIVLSRQNHIVEFG